MAGWAWGVYRWLDRIYEGKALVEKIADIVSTVESIDLRRDLIACLPEIVEDSEHALIIEKLKVIQPPKTKHFIVCI